MQPTELLAPLWHASLVLTGAIVLVLALRHPLRHGFGAQAAYLAWIVVPAALLALALPAVAPETVAGTIVRRIAQGAPFVPSVPGMEAGTAGRPWIVGLWLAGAAISGILSWHLQRRFQRRLGGVVREGGLWRAGAALPELPATVGAFAPRIVVPRDFEQRFDPLQRTLVLAHERVHAQRRDPLANLVVLALRCLFWFHPLVHLAAARFRQDQELACDACVVAGHPHLRRSYAATLLDAQLAATAGSPLGCHFGFGHPLRERLAMLKEPIHSTTRRAAGAGLVATLAICAATTAWAAGPAQADTPASPQSSGARGAAMPAPAYPKALIEQGVGGTVVLIVDVAADGSVASARVDPAHSVAALDAAALAAVRNWRFEPAMRDGKPVASRVRVPIAFDPHPQGGDADHG